MSKFKNRNELLTYVTGSLQLSVELADCLADEHPRLAACLLGPQVVRLLDELVPDHGLCENNDPAKWERVNHGQ